jgi:hypothetical protein
MRHPQLLIYETDGRLAEVLRELARECRWALREARQPEACLRLLRLGGPAVVVIKVGRDLVRELSLLERVEAHFPDTGLVVVGDVEDPALAGLAWDLGASFVLFPPERRPLLPDVVAGLMEAGQRVAPAVGSAESEPQADAGT